MKEIQTLYKSTVINNVNHDVNIVSKMNCCRKKLIKPHSKVVSEKKKWFGWLIDGLQTFYDWSFSIRKVIVKKEMRSIFQTVNIFQLCRNSCQTWQITQFHEPKIIHIHYFQFFMNTKKVRMSVIALLMYDPNRIMYQAAIVFI